MTNTHITLALAADLMIPVTQAYIFECQCQTRHWRSSRNIPGCRNWDGSMAERAVVSVGDS